ncbi:MAG: hypothetical protein QW625_01740 [Candidatus Nanoarchaeia archaeon]
MRETDFDILRWTIYGIVLVILAALSFVWQPILWVFAIVFIIALIDITYIKYYKNKLW